MFSIECHQFLLLIGSNSIWFCFHSSSAVLTGILIQETQGLFPNNFKKHNTSRRENKPSEISDTICQIPYLFVLWVIPFLWLRLQNCELWIIKISQMEIVCVHKNNIHFCTEFGFAYLLYAYTEVRGYISN